jgi:hypothetical protein
MTARLRTFGRSVIEITRGRAERTERMVEPRGRCLRGVAVPPVLAGQPPPNLDLVGIGLLVVQTAHPQERTIFSPFDGQQTKPFVLIGLLSPLSDRVGVLAAQRASEKARHLGVGVECCVERKVVEAERS